MFVRVRRVSMRPRGVVFFIRNVRARHTTDTPLDEYIGRKSNASYIILASERIAETQRLAVACARASDAAISACILIAVM